MAEVIYQDTHDVKDGPKWRVERPYPDTLPNIVRFVKQGQMRKLLDQMAHWDGSGWSAIRWRPMHPTVPQSLLTFVEDRMRGAG